jgi:hypothetical protein
MEFILGTLLICILIAFIIFLILFLSLKSSFNNDNIKNSITLSYKDFQTYYSLNTYRWTLYPDALYVNVWPVEYRVNLKTNMDVFRYHRAYNKIQEDKFKKRENKNLMDFLAAMQNDINTLREKANKELETGAKTTHDIALDIIKGDN